VWNTGCWIIDNQSDIALTVVDLDSRTNGFAGYSTDLAPHTPKTFNGVIFGWCSNSSEVARKAMVFYQDGRTRVPLFQMFQDYLDNQIYWVPAATSPSDLWGARIWAKEGPSSYVNITVGADLTPQAVAVNPHEDVQRRMREASVDRSD
jgi:hypothetical protein